jgi:pyruvate kinase
MNTRNVFEGLDDLYDDVGARGNERYERWLPRITREMFLPSARNLADYLAFRQHDVRALQEQLVPLGLSSLGRCEAHVLPTLRAVRATLGTLCDDAGAAADRPSDEQFALGEELLDRDTREIFGASAVERPHIMVTFPSEAAGDYAFVRRMVKAGMDCARINCAHDDADDWARMAANVRRAAEETGRVCRVYMDLAGPKIRTAEPMSYDPDQRFFIGDRLLLARPGVHPRHGLPQVACTVPAVFDTLREGAPVWINDGKIGATVVEMHLDGAVLEITQADAGGKRIGLDKGLNFPETPLAIASLTSKDRSDLDAVVAHADIIGQSFVRTPGDVEDLLAELERRDARIPIVAKIETAEAIHNLPEIIVSGAGRVPFGVMIARGDLAVEIGYQRLSEIQEEVLWLCEAAHVPVIWATQVLDQLVRKGLPSRAEITDAAMSERAECVMLNKGPFLVEAIATLGDVLTRMQGHMSKKSARLRALHAWS